VMVVVAGMVGGEVEGGMMGGEGEGEGGIALLAAGGTIWCHFLSPSGAVLMTRCAVVCVGAGAGWTREQMGWEGV
jgi:hypothetical protein